MTAALTHEARRGDWMQTFTGRMFWPLDPRADEIEIEDIAHALSMQCRYAGHCTRFYSVAEHCVLLAGAVEEHHALWALLHDASEAYLVDVPRPVKPFLTGYRFAEAHVMAAVAERFGLGPMPEEVKDADNRILEDERQQIMAPAPKAWNVGPALGVTVHGWEPERAERAFLSLFRILWQDHQQREGGR